MIEPYVMSCIMQLIVVTGNLTEVAGEGGTDWAPQKFLLSQQFRYLMRYKKYLEKNFLSCLVSDFWVKFKMTTRGPKRVTSQVF